MDDKQTREAVREVMDWLRNPEQHLGGQPREVAIEGILIEQFDRIRRRERRKAAGNTIMFWGGLAGFSATAIANAGTWLDYLWRLFQ